jgi:hypothetical protein
VVVAVAVAGVAAPASRAILPQPGATAATLVEAVDATASRTKPA